MTKYHKLQWNRVAFTAARMILAVYLTVSGSIACREAGLLPRDQRFRYLWFKRALRCRRFESKIQQYIYEKSLEKLGLSEFSVMTERLPLSKTLAICALDSTKNFRMSISKCLRVGLTFLRGLLQRNLPKPRALCSNSGRTCKDERLEMETQNQPLKDEPFNRTSRLCKRTQETVIDQIQQCPSTEAREARRILKSYCTRAKQDVPVGPHEILRRFRDADLRKVRDEGLYAFVESPNLD